MSADESRLLAQAERIVEGRCFLCHGLHGEAATEEFPRLAAQNAAYVAKQLANFKTGARQSSAMRAMVRDLSPGDMDALGLYFSRQLSPSHPIDDGALREAGRALYGQRGTGTRALACEDCHGPRGHGSATLPRLAGQVGAYLAAQLRQFGARQRNNDNSVMQDIAETLSEEEIRAVSAYLSSLD